MRPSVATTLAKKDVGAPGTPADPQIPRTDLPEVELPGYLLTHAAFLLWREARLFSSRPVDHVTTADDNLAVPPRRCEPLQSRLEDLDGRRQGGRGEA